MAVWISDQLCGPALGPVEGVIGMGRACLEYVEGAPGLHPLKGQIIPLALLALEELGRIMALPEVRLLGPAPALVPYYEALGCEVVANTPGTGNLRKWIPST